MKGKKQQKLEGNSVSKEVFFLRHLFKFPCGGEKIERERLKLHGRKRTEMIEP